MFVSLWQNLQAGQWDFWVGGGRVTMVAFKLKLILICYSVLKSQVLVYGRYPEHECKPRPFLNSTVSLKRQILNVRWRQVTFSVAAAHWIENKLQANCLGPLTAPRVIFTGMAFSGAFSGSVLLWNEAYMSIKAQTNILSERVQPCTLPQWIKCHFFNIINKDLGCQSVSFVKK